MTIATDDMKGFFVTFEGTEGSGKTTQVSLLADRLCKAGQRVRLLREPGGTLIGEEIRQTLKHSSANAAMTAETELLLMNAARAQLVREVIRPALAAGKIVLCDRFYDSSTAYQGYGRGLDLDFVKSVIDFAVGDTRPNLTLLLHVPLKVSEERRLLRKETMLFDVPRHGEKRDGHARLPFSEPLRDRMEEADRSFFRRVAKGFKAIADAEPDRVRIVDATDSIESVRNRIWGIAAPLLKQLAPAP